jgi:hypothetical protein
MKRIRFEILPHTTTSLKESLRFTNCDPKLLESAHWGTWPIEDMLYSDRCTVPTFVSGYAKRRPRNVAKLLVLGYSLTLLRSVG